MPVIQGYIGFDPRIYPEELTAVWIGVPKLIRDDFLIRLRFNQPILELSPTLIYLVRKSTMEVIGFNNSTLNIDESGEYTYTLRGQLSSLFDNGHSGKYKMGLRSEMITYRDNRLGPETVVETSFFEFDDTSDLGWIKSNMAWVVDGKAWILPPP